MKIVAVLLLLVAAVRGQDGPAISTEDGNLRIASQGDVVFQAGQGGQIQFMGSDGENMAVGEKGEKGDPGVPGRPGTDGSPGASGIPGRMGTTGAQGQPGMDGLQGVQGPKGDMGDAGVTGPPGPQGLRGVSASDSALITWNECAWDNLNSGQDYGQIVMCSLQKSRNDTWLRISWSGNMRITRCNTCCMRWYFTINGEECADPGPIDAVLFQSQNYHLLRHSTIRGTCRTTQQGANATTFLAGPIRVQFSLMECPGFGGFVYDAFTGWNSISRIMIEEVIPRDESTTEIAVIPPPQFIHMPNYCHYFFPHLGTNRERNLGTVVAVKFTKDHDHTILRLTWEGNFRKRSCNNCCTRWWIEINGSPCSAYENIQTSIRAATAQDVFAPTTLTGFCLASGDLPFPSGEHNIRLLVGNCLGSVISNAASGFFSTSRLIVEEITAPRDPQVNPDYYHPQWKHCAIPAIPNGAQDKGTFEATTCMLNKTLEDSSIRVTYNGNIRITGCEDCCMRWFVTLNGEECSDPAPIEAVIVASDVSSLSIHRGSTITGICAGTASGTIPAGNVLAVLNLGACEAEEFNGTLYDAFTGIDSPSTFTLEEMPQVKVPASIKGFPPIWTQCVSDYHLNEVRNATNNNESLPIQTCTFLKQTDDSVLKVTWDGNIAVLDCEDCCMRWYVTVDGQECTMPIDGALVQDLSGTLVHDLARPASIVGICRTFGPDDAMLSSGEHMVELRVGPCSSSIDSIEAPGPAETLTGAHSNSRFVVEEIPDSDNDCESQIVEPSF